MLLKNLFGCLLLGFLFAPAVFAAPAEVEAALAERLVLCQKCHMGKLALQGRAADQVLMALRQIHEGKKPHPPGVKAFTLEDLPLVTEILTRVPNTD